MKKRGISIILVNGFLLLLLLMVGLTTYSVRVSRKSLEESAGRNSMLLADEMLRRINNSIYFRAEEVEAFSQGLIFGPESGEKIRERFIDFYQKKYGQSIFCEVFLINDQKRVVARTGKSDTYRRIDEEFMRKVREGGLYLSEVEYTPDIGGYTIGIGARVNDRKENFKGILTAVISLSGILKEAELWTKRYETTQIKLVTGNGRLLYSTKPFKILENVSDKEFFKKIKGEQGYFVSRENDRERLFSYKSLDMPDWILFISNDVHEILSPVRALRRNILLFSLFLMLAGIFIALVTYRLILHSVKMREKAEQGLRESEEKLKELVIELRRSNKELEDFAFVASHDLKEPLRTISSYVTLLADEYKDKLNDEASEFIGYAVDGAERMKKLIEDLLAYSRIATKGRPFEPTNCEDTLALAVEDLDAAISESKAVITHDPLPTVMADGRQLTQLFVNLLSNALKFRTAGPCRIHISSKKKGGQWLFSVSDNGIGINPEYAKQIFAIFRRLHPRDEYPGTGIGLALCQRIVNRHQGDIRVESELGKGATFYFTMPAKGGEEK